MSLMDIDMVPHDELEGREVKEKIKKAEQSGDTGKSETLKKINAIGTMADKATAK